MSVTVLLLSVVALDESPLSSIDLVIAVFTILDQEILLNQDLIATEK